MNIPRHHCWVKDISKLLSRQDSKHHGRREYCSRCIGSFNSEKKLEKHLELCGVICRHKIPKIECHTCSKECHHGWRKQSCRDCKNERKLREMGFKEEES